MSISDANSNVEPFPKQPSSLAKLVDACVTNTVHSAHFETKTATETKAKATTTTTATMPGETNNTTAVAVANSSAPPLPSTTDQPHDSDEQEDFDRLTRTFGANKWIFNNKDVSFFFLPFIV